MINGFLISDGFYNVPGLRYFTFIEHRGVASISEPESLIVDENLSLAAGFEWKRGEVISESLRMEIKALDSDAGDFWEVRLSGFYPKIQPAVSYQFEQMKAHRWVVVPKDQNAYKYLMGDLETGAELKVSMGTKVLGGQEINGYDLTFTWVTPHIPFFYLPEEEDAYLIPEDVVFTSPTPQWATFYYYNTSDPALVASPPAANKLKFSVLAGKSLSQFTVRLGGQGLTQMDPDVPDNRVTAIAGDGTLTFKHPLPPNSELLIFVK